MYARYAKADTLEKTECCDGHAKAQPASVVHKARFSKALGFAFSLFRQVLPYLILGAAIGAFIYGFIPKDLIVAIAGPQNPLAIPVAAIGGVPIYIHTETIIPSAQCFSKREWESAQ